jgi:HSP20 family protein
MALELTPWRPFKELPALREEMEKLWGRFFGERSLAEPFGKGWAPSLDVSETKDNIVVKAEVPGMDGKDIDISLSGGVLTLKGEKKQEKEEKDENYHFTERSYGAFSRSIRLPQEVQTDKVKASYTNGVVTITLPKSEEAKAKEVKIKVQ